MAAPTPMPTTTASQIGTCMCTAMPAITPVSATTEPTERSMPPVTITKVSPTATMPISALASRIDSTLAVVRNAGVVTAR